MASITIFNANRHGVTMSVNNGPQFSIAGSAPPSWTPQSPGASAPSWSNTAPAQGVFAPGANTLSITPQGSTQPLTVTINIPRSIQWTAMQLYVFCNAYDDVSWILLNEGQFVTGNVQLSAFQATDGA